MVGTRGAPTTTQAIYRKQSTSASNLRLFLRYDLADRIALRLGVPVKVAGCDAWFATGATIREEQMSDISKKQVIAAQEAWGNGIVRIAKAHKDGGDFEQVAKSHIEDLYGYQQGTVLFKPTLAAEAQFRPSFAQALSYFVASNGACPEDKGFAIKGWTAVRFENNDIICQGASASAMGNYYFTTPEGEEVKVEYSFGYFLDSEGKLRINLHHSSMPYEAN